MALGVFILKQGTLMNSVKLKKEKEKKNSQVGRFTFLLGLVKPKEPTEASNILNVNTKCQYNSV